MRASKLLAFSLLLVHSAISKAGISEWIPVPKSHACASFLLAMSGHKFLDSNRDEALLHMTKLRKGLIEWNDEEPSLQNISAYGAERIQKKNKKIVQRILGIEKFSEAFPGEQETPPFRTYGAVFHGVEEIQKLASDLEAGSQKIHERNWGFLHPYIKNHSYWIAIEVLKVIPLAVMLLAPGDRFLQFNRLAMAGAMGFIAGGLDVFYRTPRMYDSNFSRLLGILKNKEVLKSSSFYVGKNLIFRSPPSTENTESLGAIVKETVNYDNEHFMGPFSFAGVLNRFDDKKRGIPEPTPVYIDVALWQEDEPTLTILIREADTTPRFQKVASSLKTLMPATSQITR
ncbi:MAG: hypothetical protein JWQ35_2288 [Bacteriovoracaceae bacterium]|nr:hypothetical protein [Bacteriovoracaceae bacterium]